MKRAIFIAAAMAAASSAPALAQTAPDPGRMFMINAVTPGVVSFSGEGTAQFNNSNSTNNAFSVGSNTNFGVNASVSSTNDYLVDSNALFKLATGSQLQQTIGTSSSAANTQAASESAATAANTIANTRTESAFGQDWNDFKSRAGATSNTDGSVSVGLDVAAIGGTQSIKTEAGYLAAKKDYMQQQREEAYSSVTTAATSSSSSGDSGNGIISGTFNTTNKSTSQIGATAAGSAGNTAAATATAEETYGKDYAAYTTKFNNFAGSDGKITSGGEIAAAKAAGIDFNTDGSSLSSTDYTTKKQSKIDSVFSQLQQAAASQGAAENESTAVVKVTGIGSIASLQASGESAFNVDVAARLRQSIPETNGTANGSAGGNLATSSFANQSNTQSASAFIQAFGADTVTLNKAPDGTLAGLTANGRFNVTVDANKEYIGNGLVNGVAQSANTTTGTLESAKIYVP